MTGRGALALALSLALASPPALAQQDPRLQWRTLETPHFRIHFYQAMEPIARRVAVIAEHTVERLAAPLQWRQSQVTQIVLRDSTDDANGSATAIPLNTLQLFVTAPEDLSVLEQYDDWLENLVTHEYTHILHADHISGVPAIVNAIIGKQWAPNQIQPRFILEGIAVFEESLHTRGGRLRSATWDSYLRADALARICFNLIRANPDSALLVGEQALAVAKRIKQPRALGDAHNNLGWLAAEQGQLHRADSLLGIALGIFQRIGVPQYTSVTLSNLGWMAEKRGDSVGSVKRFHEALALSEQAQDTASSAILLYSLGVAYRKIKDYDESVAHLSRAMEMERAMGRKGKEANCAVGLANTYKEQGDTLEARAAYGRATDLYRLIHDHHGSGIVQENLGDLYLNRFPRNALEHYGLALAHYDTVHSAIDKAYVLQRIGTAYVMLGDLTHGEASLKQGL